MSNDQAIEKEIQAKCLTAARVTPADIEANIAGEYYFTAQEGVWGAASAFDRTEGNTGPAALDVLTFCVLVLRNGFTVTGESACASPENFDADVGRKVARQNAINKVWPLMGYELRSRLAAGDKPDHGPALRAALAKLVGVSKRADVREMREEFLANVDGSQEDIDMVVDCLALLEATAAE